MIEETFGFSATVQKELDLIEAGQTAKTSEDRRDINTQLAQLALAEHLGKAKSGSGHGDVFIAKYINDQGTCIDVAYKPQSKSDDKFYNYLAANTDNALKDHTPARHATIELKHPTKNSTVTYMAMTCLDLNKTPIGKLPTGLCGVSQDTSIDLKLNMITQNDNTEAAANGDAVDGTFTGKSKETLEKQAAQSAVMKALGITFAVVMGDFPPECTTQDQKKTFMEQAKTDLQNSDWYKKIPTKHQEAIQTYLSSATEPKHLNYLRSNDIMKSWIENSPDKEKTRKSIDNIIKGLEDGNIAFLGCSVMMGKDGSVHLMDTAHALTPDDPKFQGESYLTTNTKGKKAQITYHQGKPPADLDPNSVTDTNHAAYLQHIKSLRDPMITSLEALKAALPTQQPNA